MNSITQTLLQYLLPIALAALAAASAATLYHVRTLALRAVEVAKKIQEDAAKTPDKKDDAKAAMLLALAEFFLNVADKATYLKGIKK